VLCLEVDYGIMPSMEAPGEITRLLQTAAVDGKAVSAELIEAAYVELRKLASAQLRRERRGHPMQTTELVHEAYMRLSKQREANWVNRSHFYAVAGGIMRNILVDQARRFKAKKRGDGKVALSLENSTEAGVQFDWDGVLDLHEALNELSEIDARQVAIVEHRFFAGLEIEEIAKLVGVSPRTVIRDWKFAQAWLHSRLLRLEDSGGKRVT
jgi:RNA polymerase sigma-70 factor, ECF subfamily